MPVKFTREGYRERADELTKLRHQFLRVGGVTSRMSPFQARAALVFGILAMALLLVMGQLLGPVISRGLHPFEEGVGTVFAKESYDEGTPDEQYLIGVRLAIEGGETVEDVVAVEPAFWEDVAEGDTVTVRYKVDGETGGIHVRMVLIRDGEP